MTMNTRPRCAYNFRDTADTWENRERARNLADRRDHDARLRQFPRLREPAPDTSTEGLYNRSFSR